MSNKKKLGQYFTTSTILKEKVFEFIKYDKFPILEPCIGRGDLISYVKNKMKNKKITNISFDMYEIDKSIKLLDYIIEDCDKLNYCDFLKKPINKLYKTIIGNPPFVKNKKCNLYLEFTNKCFNLLEDNGELIFIVPSDFFKLTSASKLLNNMINNGSFTHIFHPNNEKMFDNASIDILIFRYCKNNLLEKKTIYNDKLLNIINSNGLITFSNDSNDSNNSNDSVTNVLFQDYFDIYVGLVSGKEKVFKNDELGNIQVINGENKIEKYIYIENYPCDNKKINQYLLNHKEELLERKIRKFSDNNWFEWGAPRNITSIKSNLNKDCIYINNLTRKSNVSFVGKVNYFGGGLIMLKPKVNCNLNNIVSYINSDRFKENFLFSGRFKIGHRQISNSIIPEEFL